MSVTAARASAERRATAQLRAGSEFRPGWEYGTAELWSAGYREWLPPADLRHAVTCFWISVTPSRSGPSVASVLPDGCSDLIWQSGHGAYVAGPDTGPAPAELPAGTVIAGARFRPGAGGPVLGLPLAELRDRRVDLADCLPALARQFPADLTPGQALTQVTATAARLATARPPDALVLNGIALLAAGPATVVGLSAALSVSERQLRRRFDEAAGYGPKTVQRVLRFRRLVRHLRAAPAQPDLAGLAIRLGYADQAHLTRESSRLAGLPPAALARTFLPQGG